MPNIHIPIEHQSAPTLRYDPVLAREAALVEDPSAASRRDWDKFDWEMHSPAHDDPAIALLRRMETNPQAWVEENLELYEANRANSTQQQLPGQERWEGKEAEEQRLVNILHPSQVMRKLRMAGVDAREEEHPRARIWLNDWTRKGLVGVNAWVAPVEMDQEGYLLELSYATTQHAKDILTANFHACLNHRKVIRTITSLQDPYGPEWSIMRFNEYGVATKEKFRGWRTAMLVLIVAEILTEEEVDRAFGPPLGEAGAWYRQQLQAYRQIRVGKAI
jgi:hypothetical protein